MREISIKKYVKYLFGITFLIFIFNKVYLRPWVLENNFPQLFQIIVLSIPNLIEAVLGTLILTAILFQMRYYFFKDKRVKDDSIYLLAIGISSFYVLTQELKFHNLGGRNVYDPYDLIASIIGLIMVFVIVKKFGFLTEFEEKQLN